MLIKKAILFSLCSLLIWGCSENNSQPQDQDAYLSASYIKPVVLATEPQNYGILHVPWRPIRFQFNKLMNQQSMRRSIRFVEPYGELEVETTSVFAFENVVQFDQVQARDDSNQFFPVIGKLYQLEVTTEATDVNGNHLERPFSLFFSGEPIFKVLYAIVPNDRSKPYCSQRTLEVLFNSPVDRGRFPSIHASPPLDGQWTFDWDQVRFSWLLFYRFSDPIFDTTYKITLDSSTVDMYGHKLHGEFSSGFRTPPFEIEWTSPRDGALGVDLYWPITFSFTGAIDSSILQTAFVISPPVAGGFSFYNGLCHPTYRQNDEFDPSTSYTVSMSALMRATNGTPLRNSYSFTFRTIPFRVLSCHPIDDYGISDTAVIGRMGFLEFYLTSRLDTATVRSAFSLEPMDIAGHLSFRRENGFDFVPDTGFTANKTYVVSISDSLRSQRGFRLQPYKKVFITSN